MTSYRLTSDAENDLIDIYLYTVETFWIAQADAYEEAFTNTFELIAGNPYIGRNISDIRPGLRRFVRQSHILYYRTDGVDVTILRILGAAQDPLRHLP